MTAQKSSTELISTSLNKGWGVSIKCRGGNRDLKLQCPKTSLLTSVTWFNKSNNHQYTVKTDSRGSYLRQQFCIGKPGLKYYEKLSVYIRTSNLTSKWRSIPAHCIQGLLFSTEPWITVKEGQKNVTLTRIHGLRKTILNISPSRNIQDTYMQTVVKCIFSGQSVPGPGVKYWPHWSQRQESHPFCANRALKIFCWIENLSNLAASA